MRLAANSFAVIFFNTTFTGFLLPAFVLSNLLLFNLDNPISLVLPDNLQLLSQQDKTNKSIIKVDNLITKINHIANYTTNIAKDVLVCAKHINNVL